MSNLTFALIVVMAINVMLVLGQSAVLAINPSAANFYNSNGSILSEFNAGNETVPVLKSDDPSGIFPNDSAQVSEGTGNPFTDTWAKLKTWFLESTGLAFTFNLLGAPYRFLSFIGLPQMFTFAIGSLWYGVTLFLLIAFIFGRDA